jgi:phage/plasmid-like protein (TIGR03299 family)
MAHEIDTTTGRPAIAFVGDTPWHGLGTELAPGAALEVWAQEAGLNWTAERSPLFRSNGRGALTVVHGRQALYRSDTGGDLGIVSNGYQVVQPAEVLEFYRTLTEGMGLRLEVAGALSAGKKVWALAKTGESLMLPGDDEVRGYVLLATSYDGTMATVATRTSVRVVCNNTLSLAVGPDGQKADVRIPHHSTFNADQVRGQLGLADSAAWSLFQEKATATAARKVSREEAVKFFMDVLYPGDEDVDTKGKLKVIETLETLRIGAVGQHTLAANDTAWGLVNAITYFADHARGEKVPGSRLNKAWFGDGDQMKRRAFEAAVALAA